MTTATAVTIFTKRANSSSTVDGEQVYSLVESKDDYEHGYSLRQAVTDETVIAKIAIGRGFIRLESLPTSIFIGPTNQGAPRWGLSRAVAATNQTELINKHILAQLSDGILLDTMNIQDAVVDVQVGSSLPEGEAVTMSGEDANGEPSTLELPNSAVIQQSYTTSNANLPPSPRLASKFRRETVVETPATDTRFVAEAEKRTGTPASPRPAHAAAQSLDELHETFSVSGPPQIHPMNVSSVEEHQEQHQEKVHMPFSYHHELYNANPIAESMLHEQSLVQDETPSAGLGSVPLANMRESIDAGEQHHQVPDDPPKALDTTLDGGSRSTTLFVHKRKGSTANRETIGEPPDKKLKVDDSQVGETPTPSLRKRGRPRKTSGDRDDSQAPHRDVLEAPISIEEGEGEGIESSADPPTVEPKRRGRPPKSSLASNAHGSTAATTLTVLKRRGRPRKTTSMSPRGTAIPTSSAMRSSPRVNQSRTAKINIEQPHQTWRVLFSNALVKDQPQKMKEFKKYISRATESRHPDDFDVLVVGSGALKKTPKLLIAVAMGKPVVTERWVTESIHAKALLPTDRFLPKPQMQWGYYPADRSSRNHLFRGKTLHITPALKRFWAADYQDIEMLGKAMGADEVVTKSTRGLHNSDDIIVIGLEKDDGDCAALVEKGETCYNRDLLPYSALRGLVEWDSSEFQILATPSPQSQKVEGSATVGSGKRGRPRKNT